MANRWNLCEVSIRVGCDSALSVICKEALQKTTTILIQVNRFLGPCLKFGLKEYESGLLPAGRRWIAELAEFFYLLMIPYFVEKQLDLS
jgi:hypothetical protein